YILRLYLRRVNTSALSVRARSGSFRHVQKVPHPVVAALALSDRPEHGSSHHAASRRHFRGDQGCTPVLSDKFGTELGRATARACIGHKDVGGQRGYKIVPVLG